MGAAVPPLGADLPRPVVDRVRAFIDAERLLRRPRKLLVAVSGGPDSVAALLLMRTVAAERGFDVVAGHFDHGLREDSRDDLAWVRALCERLDVPCLTGEGDVASAARERKAGLEDTARTMRYQFLAFVAGKEGADALVTGHTADDQAETVAQRILRGTGVRGLRGMLPAAPVPGASAQRLIRPLLCISRVDTLAVCAAADIEPRLDPSNEDRSFQRNQVRHELLPALRLLNPSVEAALRGLAASAREVFGDVERAANSLVAVERGIDGSVFHLGDFGDLQTEAQLLVIEREAGFSKSAVQVNRTRLTNLRTALKAGAGHVVFGETLVEISAGLVRIGTDEDLLASFEPKLLNVPGATLVGPWRAVVTTDPQPPAPPAIDAVVPTWGITGALRVRRLAAGDRFVFRGRERSVAAVLANEKVPTWVRRRLIAVSDSRRVLALVGGPERLDAQPDDDSLYVRLVPVAR